MYNKPDGGCRSETYFHRIDMIIIFIKKEEIIYESIEVHNEEPRNLFSSPVSWPLLHGSAVLERT
jgi:hypothetical protein